MTITNSTPNAGQVARLSGRVFLTGGTGFLGVHLLRDLLENSDVSVTCLARGGSDDAATRNLERHLAWHFPDWDLGALRQRFQVVSGDLEAPDLGLKPEVYSQIADSHQFVLNSAADVHHVGAASRSFRINTEAVLTLIELSKRGTPKQFHQISTVSVRGDFKGPTRLTAFKETHLEEGQSFSDAYRESKYRAEVASRKAFEQGLPGAVYRVGYVGPHSVTARYQRNIHQSNTARYVRACVRLGFAPYLECDTVRLTPVDSVARAIVQLMTRNTASGQTYYVESPQQIRQYDVLRCLQAAGFPLRILSLEDFLEKSARVSQDTESLSALTPEVEAGEGQAIPTDATWSLRELRRCGFEYPRLTSAWLGRFLAHAIEVGFIEAPRFWNLGPVIPDLF